MSSEFPPNVGGIGNHAYNLAKALANEGFEVSVVTDIIGVDEKELDTFSTKENFKIYWVRRRRFLLKTYLVRVSKALAVAKKADKIICSGKFPLWIAVLIRLKHPKKELTAVVHGTELDLRAKGARALTSHSLGRFNKIISVSNYTQQFLPKSLPPAISKFIIHNGINGDEFNIEGSPALAGDPALITVGNVTDRKGQENVVNALDEISATYPLVQYHVVGKPTNRQKIEDRAKQLKVGNKIRFYGAVERGELLQKLKGSKIKLMLSNHTEEGDFEGFGIAVLEANALGVPAIGSKDSGIADAIVQSKTGLLVDQRNAKEVAKAVKTILTNYSLFSNNAKAWAMQHDWKFIVKEYVAALNA